MCHACARFIVASITTRCPCCVARDADVWEGGGGRSHIPHARSILAEGVAQLGDLDGALDLIEESIAQIERPGSEERCYYAEILSIKGWLLSLKGDPEGAERAYPLPSIGRGINRRNPGNCAPR